LGKQLYDRLRELTTEATNVKSLQLDRLSIPEITALINDEDHLVAPAVRKVLPQVNRAIETVTASFLAGGRLFYVGAGTSGRLGVLDASECPPTFGVRPGMVQGIIAGGRRTLVRSREGVEDDTDAAVEAIDRNRMKQRDTVLGIAASGRTPFVQAALRRAKQHRAATILLACNRLPKVPGYIDLVINPVLGPEVLAGSTRMKAGSACKMILNMITTVSMVQLGKCFGNRMVDLRATSEKLVERSRRILVETTGISYRQAGALLRRAHGEVKTAVLMQLSGLSYDRARKALRSAGGKLHRALSRE
jgi:N-acetylmuramic acid 6-phosphate etherase